MEKARPRIGVLTDTTPLNKMIEGGVDPERYEAVTFDSSEAGLRGRLREENLSLLFLKTELKNDNGLEICRELRDSASNQAFPIIFLSTSDNVAATAMEYRADYFLKIPFGPERVRGVLGDFVNEKTRILFTDDSEMMHKAVAPELRRAGFEVFEAYNGKDALTFLETGDLPDLIISDLEMPELDGYGFCTAVKEDVRFKEIPFIICSSLDSEESIEKGFAAGANDYLTKPFVIPELITRIREHMRKPEEFRPENILVVEEDSRIRGIILQALRFNGFNPQEARNGRTALTRLRGEKFHLVISSYELPFLNGRELTLRIRAEADLQDVPVLMIHSRESRSELVRLRSVGIQAFIPKPFHNDRLLAEVERVLAQSRLERERQVMRHYLADETIRAVEAGATSGDEIKVENQFRTILFTDIAKFTPLCENLEAHEVVDLLNNYFDHMVAILIKYGASIDKFIGDAIMALFDRQADGAHRAVCASVEMINALGAVRKETGVDIHMRVGINAGHVIMGDIGSRHYRRDHTAIGDNVNTANRLESNAGIDGILISESTYNLLPGLTVAEPRRLTVKGKKDELTAYQLKKVKPYRGELTSTIVGGPQATVLADN